MHFVAVKTEEQHAANRASRGQFTFAVELWAARAAGSVAPAALSSASIVAVFQCFNRCSDPDHIGIAQGNLHVVRAHVWMRGSFHFVSLSDAAKRA